jgi:arylsulfatase A-like enzyme/Tfp pilus assembly protein PilF
VALISLATACDRSPRPNLVLITLDTTRADHLGSYGYDRETSAALDGLAAAGVRFERSFSHVPITLPAHTSILSGTLPLHHGVRDNGRFVVPDDLDTLPELLKDEGYATGAFVSGFVLDSRFGLDQGFDVYDDAFTEEWSEEKLRDARIYNQMVTDRPADQTTERALAWLHDQAREPYFLWVHYYDPHQRYAPPHPYDQLFHDNLYDGEIAFMDSQIALLLEALKERQEWDRTAVVVTADHGEGLGQHDETTHAVLAYDSTLRVPLIIKTPAAIDLAAGVVDDNVSHVDLLPTMLELAGIAPPTGLPGQSLLPTMTGEGKARRPAYFESSLPRFSFGWEPLFGIRADGWKYIHAPQPELYDLREDADEIYNLAASERDRKDALERLLFRTIEATKPLSSDAPRQREMDADVRRRLAALGYVGGTSGGKADLNSRRPSGRRSPNSGIVYLADYYLANALAGWGRLEEAAAIYRTTLLPLDGDNPSFLTTLANLERRLGRMEAAFELYRRAQAVDPEDASILVELAQLERDRGRLEAAAELLAAARELAPDNLSAAYLEAALAARSGQGKKAVDSYRAALDIDPSHRDSLINLAIELAKTGDNEGARTSLRTALDVAPFSARAHYNLGLLELNAGRNEIAARAFERALRYERPYPGASLGLAMALIELGDDDTARRELEQLLAEAKSGPAIERARVLLDDLGGQREESP